MHKAFTGFYAFLPQPVSMIENRPGRRWDIFCRLVDNMGDIGVCWRLARILSVYHGRRVRLWLDDVEAFRRLCPEAGDDVDPLVLEGVEVWRWREPSSFVDCAEVVVEAFACDPPRAYLEAMALCSPAPLWINLEYLTAEPWIDELHGMASPHPRLPLVKRFFFPGFSPASGGLLREPELFSERDRFVADKLAINDFLHKLGCAPVDRDSLLISLFSYEQSRLPALMAVWANGGRPIRLIVPEGRVIPDVAACFGRDSLVIGEKVSRGNLSVEVVPFVSQRDYDRLLWCCELNFVRGEDSFVRAQWAGKPFVWHIYRQDEDAHQTKLEAFLDRYLSGAGDSMAAAARDFWRAWNDRGDIAAAWPAFGGAMPVLASHAKHWADQLSASEDLARRICSLEIPA